MVGAERFLTEIRMTANLQHPHILPLHDSGEADGLLFYVMPHVEGESLRHRLDREHQLPVDEAVRIATNVAEALDYAHRVANGDVWPEWKEGTEFRARRLEMSGGRGVRALLGVLTPVVLAPVLATGAAAQSLPIEGTVAAATGEPLAGAVVYLLDSELQGLRAVLSDGGGAFRLTAPGPGRYSLEVERIGSETSLFPPFEVPEGGIRNLSLRVQVRPIEIEGISVTAETVCDIAGGGGDLVGVWTEARKALTATVLSEGQGNLLFTLEVSQRRLTARDLILHEEIDTLLTDWNSAFAFVPVADLGDAGWGRLDGPALAEVFGPSPEILLSPWFTDNHCLGVAPPSPDSLVGLAFTSKEGAFDVGIEGAFWFETPSWLLRRISFRFSGPLGLENATEQGGEIVLTVGSEGSWYVHSWRILVPTWVPRPGGLFGGGRVPQVTGFVESGGRVIALSRGP